MWRRHGRFEGVNEDTDADWGLEVEFEVTFGLVESEVEFAEFCFPWSGTVRSLRTIEKKSPLTFPEACVMLVY